MKAAVNAVQAGLQTPAEATIGFTETQNQRFDDSVSQAHGKSRRKAAVSAAVTAVQAGWQTPLQSSANLTGPEKSSVQQALKDRATKNSKALGDSTAVDPSKLSENDREKRRNRAVETAAKAVLTGARTPERAAFGFTNGQMLALSRQLLEATRSANSSQASCTVAAEPPKKGINYPRCPSANHKNIDGDGDSDGDGDDDSNSDDDSENESGYSSDTMSTMSSQVAASAIDA